MPREQRERRSQHEPTNSDHGLLGPEEGSPVAVVNPEGSADVLLICEHASHDIPRSLNQLGLDRQAALSHVAWDPGAKPVALMIARLLDAPLILQRFSRLVYDCNRPPDAASAIPVRSEIFDIPGNAGLGASARQARIDGIYQPFRRAIAEHLDRAAGLGRTPAIVTVHSFTPVFHGQQRTVEIGLLHDTDARLADAMLADQALFGDLVMNRNTPYGPEDGVTHTLKEHALPRGLPNVMIEVRNDLIAETTTQTAMAERLAVSVRHALDRLAAPDKGLRTGTAG